MLFSSVNYFCRSTTTILRVAVVCLGVVTLACGDDEKRQSVAGPSPVGQPGLGNAPAGGAVAGPGAGAGNRSLNGGSGPAIAEGDLVDDRPVIRVKGQLPPGLTPAMLEADLRDELAAEDAWQDMPGQVRGLDRPDAPGEHEITSITSSGSGDPLVYSMTINLQPPVPAPTHTGLLWIDRHDGRNKTRVLRADLDADQEVHTETDTITLGREANGDPSMATHKIQPGWYVVWSMARNCNTQGSGMNQQRRCKRGPISVETHEVVAPPPPARPDPPRMTSELQSWTCSQTSLCTATVDLSFPGALTGNVDIELEFLDRGLGHLSREYATNDPSAISYNGLLPGAYRTRVRQKRVGSRNWSDWRVNSRDLLTVEPDPTEGSLPGAPRNVTATKISDWRWRVSWDAPAAHGGWAIENYRMGIHGRSANGRQSRSCGGESWPYQNVTDPEHLGGADGRRYSQVLLSFVPDDEGSDWKVGVTAVNFRGEGPCASFDPFP